MRLENKNAIVTGAAKGMGGAITRTLAREGADIVLTARDLDALEPVAEEVRTLGRRTAVVRCDVTDDAEVRAMVDEEKMNAQVAGMICEARVAAGLTQAQLADLVGTSQPNIARLEDAEYEGHSLSMLRRIAAALSHRLQVRFVPDDSRS